MKKLIVLALMILLSGNLMADAATNAAEKLHPYEETGVASDDPTASGAFMALINDFSLTKNTFSSVLFGLDFNEAATIPEGTRFPVGPAGVGNPGTVDFAGVLIQSIKNGVTTAWGVDGETTVSGFTKVVISSTDVPFIIIEYNIRLKKALKQVGADPIVRKSLRIRGKALLHT